MIFLCLFNHFILSETDIAHICCKFVGPLPSSMGDFASFVHKVFPYIVDTKHLISASNAIQYLMKKSSKSLSSAFSLLCPKISSSPQSSASNSYVKVEVETNETCETGYVLILYLSLY